MNIQSTLKTSIFSNRIPRITGDVVFYILTVIGAAMLILLLSGILFELITTASDSLKKFGLGFIYTYKWNPVTGEYGALSSIFGTVVSTVIALIIAIPTSLVIALFLVELAHPRIGNFFGSAIELLAAIPSIIYGMWGLFVFAPFMANYIQPFLGNTLGFLPLFKGPPMGIGVLTAGIVLAIMVLPFITSIVRDVFHMVPAVVKEAAYGTGATQWEVVRAIVMPYSFKGIIGGCFLGLGRALGETMAVTFVIGNSHRISASLFESGNSIASCLANEFTEAADPLHLSALVHLGLVLFMLTVVIQIAAQLWLKAIHKTGQGRC